MKKLNRAFSLQFCAPGVVGGTGKLSGCKLRTWAGDTGCAVRGWLPWQGACAGSAVVRRGVAHTCSHLAGVLFRFQREDARLLSMSYRLPVSTLSSFLSPTLRTTMSHLGIWSGGCRRRRRARAARRAPRRPRPRSCRSAASVLPLLLATVGFAKRPRPARRWTDQSAIETMLSAAPIDAAAAGRHEPSLLSGVAGGPTPARGASQVR